MKALLLIAAIALSPFGNQSFASGKSELVEKIESITLEPESYKLSNATNADFVKVRLKANEEGQLEILEINYSNQKLKDLLVQKLKEIEVNTNQSMGQILNYKFTFELI